MTEHEEEYVPELRMFVAGFDRGSAFAWREAAKILRRATREVADMPDDGKYMLLSFAKLFAKSAKAARR